MADVDLPVYLIRPMPSIPKVISDSMYKQWKKWNLPRYAVKGVKKDCGISGYPYLVEGDFDSDTKTDYAFWAVVWEESSREINLYVYESSTNKIHLLEKSYENEFWLDPLYIKLKGTKVYDYETDQESILAHDSIGAMICGKSSREWVKNNKGTYTSLWTSD